MPAAAPATGTASSDPSTSKRTRARRPPKPAFPPLVWCRAWKVRGPATVASISSDPMRSTQGSGKPSVDSTGIVEVPEPTPAVREVIPRVSTPVEFPLTSRLIWSGRLPRTSRET